MITHKCAGFRKYNSTLPPIDQLVLIQVDPEKKLVYHTFLRDQGDGDFQESGAAHRFCRACGKKAEEIRE